MSKFDKMDNRQNKHIGPTWTNRTKMDKSFWTEVFGH